MRPYQIVATERILQRIEISTNYKQLGTHRGRRLRLAHHRLGQDADQLQGRPARHPHGGRREGAVRRRPQGPRLPDHARVRPVREGRGELEHLNAGAEEAARGPGRADHHHDDPEARHVHRGEQGARHLRRARRDHLRRVPPLAVRRHAHRDHQGVQALPPVRLHRHADLRGQRRARAATRSCAPPSRRSASGCTPTRSSTRSTTRTCCRSASTTSTRSRSPRTSRTSRCRPSTPSERCSLASGSPRSSATRWSTSTRRPSAAQHYSLGDKRVSRLQRAVRHRVDRGRQALLHRVRQAAAGAAAGPPAQGRADLLLRRRTKPKSDGYLDEEDFETDALDQSSRDFLEAAIRTTTPCSARATTPRRTSSRTTTRTCRCG